MHKGETKMSAPHSAHFIITPLKPTPSDEARQMCHENYKTPSGIVFTVPGPQPQEVEFWTDVANIPGYSMD